MDNRIGTNPEVRQQILDAYALLGCPPEQALQLVNTAFAAHNLIEDERARIIGDVGNAFAKLGTDDEFEGNYLILVTQLELMHLNLVLQSLQDQMGPTIEITGEETVQ